MNQEKKRCAALTKAGTPCKNYVMPGSAYCRVHQPPGETPAAKTPPPPAAEASLDAAELQEVLEELNRLAAELKRLTPDYSPPPFSPKKLRNLLKKKLSNLAPANRLETLQDLQASFQGATPKDFLYPETWQGLWYIINHLIEEESGPMREKIAARIASLPGGNLTLVMKDSIQDTPPKEFLDLETWKGMWYVTKHMLELEKETLKERIFGSNKKDE